jgi:hypothetical protein
MSRFLDLRFLWVIGATMLVFGSVGLLLVGALVGLPLSLGAGLMGISQETVLKWLAYSSPMWGPIGFGMGMIATSSLMRGLRREEFTND